MADIHVIDANAERVRLTVDGVEFVLGCTKGRIMEISRSKADAQVHDRDACWISNFSYRKMIQQALAIFAEKRRFVPVPVRVAVPTAVHKERTHRAHAARGHHQLRISF